MRKSCDLWITNCLTNEIEIIHNFSDVLYTSDSYFVGRYLMMYLKPYFDNQVPIKLELIV